MKRFFIVLVLLLGTVNLFGGGGPFMGYPKCTCGEEIHYDLNEVYEHREHLTDLEITDFIYKSLGSLDIGSPIFDGDSMRKATLSDCINRIVDDDKRNFFWKYIKLPIEKEGENIKKIANEKANAELVRKIVVGDELTDFIFTDSKAVSGTITEICLVKDDLWRIECACSSEKIFKFYVKNGDKFSKIEYVAFDYNYLEEKLQNLNLSLSEFASYIGVTTYDDSVYNRCEREAALNLYDDSVYNKCLWIPVHFSGKIKNITYNSFELEIIE